MVEEDEHAEKAPARQRESGQEAVFDAVPDDSLVKVLLRLPLREMVRASAVCRRWLAVERAVQKSACIDAWQDETRMCVGVPTTAATLATMMGVVENLVAMPLYMEVSARTFFTGSTKSLGMGIFMTIGVINAALGKTMDNANLRSKILVTSTCSDISGKCDSAGRTLLLAIVDSVAKPDNAKSFATVVEFAERSGVNVAALLNTATASPYTNTWCGEGGQEVVAAGTSIAHLAIRREQLAITRAALLRGGVIMPRLSPAQMSDLYEALVNWPRGLAALYWPWGLAAPLMSPPSPPHPHEADGEMRWNRLWKRKPLF